MPAKVIKAGNRVNPERPIDDAELVGYCFRCDTVWTCAGSDVAEVTVNEGQVCWWMGCPSCGHKAGHVATRDSEYGRHFLGKVHEHRMAGGPECR